MTDERDRRDHTGQTCQRERDASVEATGFGVRPGVQGPDHLAARLGVGAIGLRGAGVADLPLTPVANEPSMGVELGAMQMLALRALPGVELVVIGEARSPVALGAAVEWRAARSIPAATQSRKSAYPAASSASGSRPLIVRPPRSPLAAARSCR